MGMERVTVEQNGERFTLEVPEGTSDADIQSFLSEQQGQTQEPSLTKAPANPATAIEPYAAGVGTKLASDYYTATRGGIPGAIVREAGALGKALGQSTPGAWADALSKPVEFTKEGIKALAERYAGSNIDTPIKDIVKNFAKTQGPGIARGVGSSVVGALTAPENLLMLPYGMAAYEQEKIRENPNAPGLEKNPYAQSVRGEYATPGAAGAANTREVIANMPYGNVTPEEKAILDRDKMERQMRLQQREKDKQILKQPPTAQNYMERMQALSNLYGSVKQ